MCAQVAFSSLLAGSAVLGYVGSFTLPTTTRISTPRMQMEGYDDPTYAVDGRPGTQSAADRARMRGQAWPEDTGRPGMPVFTATGMPNGDRYSGGATPFTGGSQRVIKAGTGPGGYGSVPARYSNGAVPTTPTGGWGGTSEEARSWMARQGMGSLYGSRPLGSRIVGTRSTSPQTQYMNMGYPEGVEAARQQEAMAKQYADEAILTEQRVQDEARRAQEAAERATEYTRREEEKQEMREEEAKRLDDEAREARERAEEAQRVLLNEQYNAANAEAAAVSARIDPGMDYSAAMPMSSNMRYGSSYGGAGGEPYGPYEYYEEGPYGSGYRTRDPMGGYYEDSNTPFGSRIRTRDPYGGEYEEYYNY